MKVTRFSDHGAYLDGGSVGEILMPNAYVQQDLQVGDVVKVFVYLDQAERLVGTTEQPLARVGDFAYLQVAWVNNYGAFLDWGLMKDLFVPFREILARICSAARSELKPSGVLEIPVRTVPSFRRPALISQKPL